jgi:hypothetical protein
MDIFIPNLVLRPFYPPMHGVPGSSQRKGIRMQSGATAFFVDPDNAKASDDNKGWDAEFPLETIAEAIDKASAEDYIFISPGEYDESLEVDKSLTIVGLGGHSAVIINPTTVGDVGMTISADDVKLINLSIFGESTADYALAIADEFNRFSAYNCEFAGPDANVVQITGAVNILFDECSFSGGGNGIEIIEGAAVTPDAIYVKNCFFSDLTDAHIEGAATAVTRLVVQNCIHDANTVPTKFFNVDGAGSTGIIAGCQIAHATNATAVIDIATDIFWVANMTEAGVSAARPA